MCYSEENVEQRRLSVKYELCLEIYVSLLKYLSIIVVALAVTVCESSVSRAESERPSTSSGSTPAPSALKVTPLRLAVDLVDGSHIIGVPAIKSIALQTSYAKMDIALKQILTLTVDADNETASFTLANGDRLNGVLSLLPLELRTVFGDVSIGTGHIKELRVIMSNGSIPAALKQSIVLHYSFDLDQGNTVKDLSKSTNNGTIHNATLVEDDWMRRGLKLDGENDYVHIPNSESLEIRKELTICTWAKIKSFGPGGSGNEHGFIVNKGNSMWWNPAFHLGYAKGSGSRHPRWPAKPGPFPALFHVCNSTGSQHGGGKTVKSDTLLHAGKWYHIAGTYDGKQVKIYINGTLEGTANYTGTLRADRAPVLIGGSKLGGTGWGNQFTTDATIDEVMIFSKALTDAEIQTVYRAKPAPPQDRRGQAE